MCLPTVRKKKLFFINNGKNIIKIDIYQCKKWAQIVYDSDIYFTDISQQLKQHESAKRCFISVSKRKQNLCCMCENSEAIQFVLFRQTPSNFQSYAVEILESQFLGQTQSSNTGRHKFPPWNNFDRFLLGIGL